VVDILLMLLLWSPAVQVSFFLVSGLFFSSLSGIAYAQDEEDPGLRAKSVKVTTPDNEGMFAYGGSGIGIFQDIQVPVNDFNDTRGDGSAIAEENKDHVGLPLFVGIGYRTFSGSFVYDVATVEGTQIRATAGPSSTQSSSYTRLELLTAARYNFMVRYTDMWIGMRAGIRRSFFNNVSNSHFVESGILRASTGLQRGSFGLTGFFGYAPLSRVGYTTDGVTGGDYFRKATATVSEAGLTAALKLRENTFFDIGAEQESIRMSIKDIMEYNGFGLNVTPSQQTTREYNLSTVMIKAGFRKLF
jgi:hypothetical protein